MTGIDALEPTTKRWKFQTKPCFSESGWVDSLMTYDTEAQAVHAMVRVYIHTGAYPGFYETRVRECESP